MAEDEDPINLDSLSLSDTEADDTQDLFASPSSKRATTAKASKSNLDVQRKPPFEPADSDEDALAAHEAALHQELNSLRSMNSVIFGINASLEKAKTNMNTVSATVNNASMLLSTWTRILSQTEHNQRLILNPNWQGASQDLVDMETEETQRKQEGERRALEDERRARQRQAEREEEERKRALEPSRTLRGSRGKYTSRGTARSSGYVGVGGQTGAKGTSRGSNASRSSVIPGRGTGPGRGRGRGV